MDGSHGRAVMDGWQCAVLCGGGGGGGAEIVREVSGENR